MDFIVESKLKNIINNSILKYQNNSTRLSFIITYNGNDIIYGDDDIYDIGSISKVFTSLLIIDLYKQNKLDLNDTIDKYIILPKGKYPTIASLLMHRAGYYNLTPFNFTFFSLLIHHYKNKNPYENIVNEDIKKEIIKRRKHLKSNYGYSDYAYAILTIVIENVLNNHFDVIMNEYLKRIGMKKSNCIYDNLKRISKKNWIWHNNNPYLSSGGIASCNSDMLAFVKYELNNNDGLEFNILDKHNLTYFTTKKGSIFYHVGGVGYFRSAMLINPKRKIGIVVMGNNIGKRGANPYYIAKLLYTAIRRNKIKWE